MLFIAHRINTIENLKSLPEEYGVELDLRDEGKNLILQHDPFQTGEDFEAYIQHFHHAFIILNIKSERIEFKVLEILQKYKVQNYFFLDSSFPMIYLLSEQQEGNVAIRFSEFEGLDTILAMKDRVRWVWVDCFTRLPINPENYKSLKNAGFKLCLVSPELQGRKQDIERYRNYFTKEKIFYDAICTKTYNIHHWNVNE